MACRDCVSGVLHSGTPTGWETTIHGLPTYVAEPSADAPPKGLLVIVPDAFGWTFVNNRVLADAYAKRGGFLVYLPEFMNGKAMPGKLMTTMPALSATGLYATLLKPYYLVLLLAHFIPFLLFNRPSVARPRVYSFLTALRSAPTTAHLGIGVAGFCWGGKYAVELTHPTATTPDGKPLVDVAFTAHPSFVKVPEDVEKVRRPLSIAIGTKDMVMNVKAIERVQDVLAGLEKKERVVSEVVVYEGAKHGFAVRGNPGDEKEKEHGQKAEDQAVAWFAEHLASG
ncbi:MAG: hypothetical protein M1817_005973 [Caeruleum heppii]|nr:MAG: hypothetical protein M1817_005973 [Caeruleum heppii]